MYNNLVNQNPMVNQFNGYMLQNPNRIPFQNNQLIGQNVHVMNNLNDLMQQHRTVQQNMGMYQNQLAQNTIPIPTNNNNINTKNSSNKSNNKPKTTNIIEEMLKPQKIVKDNKDIDSNYKVSKDNYKVDEKGRLIKKFKVTNAPYKNIIKDRIISKKVEDITEDDMLVHKSIKEIDANIERFNEELDTKQGEKEKINDELKIEFHIDNYDKHKKNFEYKESFIKNLAFEQNTFDENKQDYIDFYRQKQKEAEEGQKLCDQILHNIVDDGVINKNELPSEDSNNDQNIELDLKSIMSTIQTEDEPTNIKQKSSSKQKSGAKKENISKVPDKKSTKEPVAKKSSKEPVAKNKTTVSKTSIQPSNKSAPTKSAPTKNTPSKESSQPLQKKITISSSRSKQLNSNDVVKV